MTYQKVILKLKFHQNLIVFKIFRSKNFDTEKNIVLLCEEAILKVFVIFILTYISDR